MKSPTHRRSLGMLVVVMLLVGGLIVPTASATEHVETIVVFDAAAGELPEGVAVDNQGNVFVSLTPLGEVVKVAAGTNVAEPFGAVPGLEEGDLGLAGLAVDSTGNVYGGVLSANPEAHGVWMFDRDTGDAGRVPGTDQIAFANAIAFAPDGTMYITDTIQGAVWRVAGDGEAELWIADPLLEGDGSAGFGFPIGANGIAVYQNTVYVGVSEQASIVTIPIQPDGSAGEAQLHLQYDGAAVDGIALDVRGNIYIADPIANQVVRANTDGSMETLATDADGLDAPTSVAFGRGQGLYVVNFSVGIQPPGGAGPSLARIQVGSTPDGIPDRLTPVTITFSLVEELEPGTEWQDDAGFHFRGGVNLEDVSGDISGTATIHVNGDFIISGECTEESCEGIFTLWLRGEIESEEGGWTLWAMATTSGEDEQPQLVDGILIGRGAHAGQVIVLEEIVEETEESVTLAGGMFIESPPTSGQNVFFDACITGPDSAAGGFVGTLAGVEDAGEMMVTFTLGGSLESGLVMVRGQFVGEHGTLNFRIAEERHGHHGVGTAVLLGGHGAYADAFGKAKVLVSDYQSDQCATGAAVRGYLIGTTSSD